LGIAENRSDNHVAHDANIDKSFIEIIRSKLEFKFEATNKATSVIEEDAQKRSRTEIIGKHLWDISEYDNIRVIKIYEANHLIVVLTKSHTSLGATADTVLGYVNECNEDEQEEQEESPPCLF
jgi:hypothetical protein